MIFLHWNMDMHIYINFFEIFQDIPSRIYYNDTNCYLLKKKKFFFIIVKGSPG